MGSTSDTSTMNERSASRRRPVGTGCRPPQRETDAGFSLIELMVVIVIIGVLSAIAVPTFLNQRGRLWERAALSDLRNTAVIMEQYLADNGTYPSSTALAGAYQPHLSQGVTLTTVQGGGGTTGYCLQVEHASLPGATFALASSNGRPSRGASC